MGMKEVNGCKVTFNANGSAAVVVYPEKVNGQFHERFMSTRKETGLYLAEQAAKRWKPKAAELPQLDGSNDVHGNAIRLEQVVQQAEVQTGTW